MSVEISFFKIKIIILTVKISLKHLNSLIMTLPIRHSGWSLLWTRSGAGIKSLFNKTCPQQTCKRVDIGSGPA